MKRWRIWFTDGTYREVDGTSVRVGDGFLVVESRGRTLSGRPADSSETFVLANLRSWTEITR